MVDINLIGDDRPPFEGEENEKEYERSYESDLSEPAPSSYIGGGRIDDSNYTHQLSRAGSKKLVYILAALSVILLAAVAYFLFYPGKGKEVTTYKPPTTTLSEAETPKAEDTSDAFNRGTASTMLPATALAPALRERIVKSSRGISTMNDVLSAIPSNINFTIIQYNDGKFFMEFLAASDADINQVNSQLQQRLASANVNLLSKENRTIQNRRLRQALINGSVNFSQVAGGTNPQAPIYLTSTELKNRLTNLCLQAGLTLRQFDAGREKAEGELMILPVLFKATGQKKNIMAFLQQLISSNANISFAKISLIAKEVDLTNPDLTLLLNIELYRTI